MKIKLAEVLKGTFGIDKDGRIAKPTLNGPQLEIKAGYIAERCRFVGTREGTLAYLHQKGARIIVIYDGDKPVSKGGAPAVAEVIVYPEPQEVK